MTCSPFLDRFELKNFSLGLVGQWAEEAMKRSKFSEAQIAFVLKQAEEGTTIGEVCRKTGISEATS